jgi:hypothetical protein
MGQWSPTSTEGDSIVNTNKQPRRLIVGLAAAILGTAGLSLSVLPSFAQESKAPASSQDQTTATTAPLHEGGSQSSGNQSSGTSPTEGPITNGNRIENISPDLRLESARIESENIHDTDQEYALFHFGRVIHEVKNPSGFSVKGFDVNHKATAADARLAKGDPTSVVVGFAHNTDLRGYRLASVDTGAVEDESGKGNLPSSMPLDGSVGSSGTNLTAAPDLVSVRPINALNRVVYTYDEQLDEKTGGDASRFGYYAADGKMVAATSIVTTVDNTVTAQFDRQTEDGVLYYAKAGGAKDLRGLASTPGSIGTGTTAPNLASVSSVIGTTQFDYTFDRPVTDVALDKFVLYSSDGTAFPAKGIARPSAEVVRIAIPEIHDYSAKMVLASVDEGAVKADDGSGVTNTIGSRQVGSQSAAGLSSGPYLSSLSLDQAAGQVLFVFDKPVDDNATYEAKDFMLMTPNGDLVQARSMVEVKGNTVLMNFDKNIVGAARGAALNDGAVKDFQGQKSPARSIRL